MTQHDDPLIQGYALSEWEGYMSEWEFERGGILCGFRVEPDDRNRLMTHAEYLPENPFLGIHHSGPRMGARITMADLGWRHDEQRGREGV